MVTMFEFEKAAHGPNQEMETLKQALFTKVIPRLLRPLETGGRTIQPCLIHSDLWPGNAMLDADTGETMVFDSCAFWGHNEAEMGSWRAERYLLGRPYVEEYVRVMGVSEPKGDFEERNALYAL